MHIAALMNCIHDYGRRALEGIARYGNAQGGWTIGLYHREQVQQAMPRLSPEVDGLIAHAHSPKLLQRLAHANKPVVNTSAVSRNTPLSSILPDNPAIGRLAAEDLLGRGHRRLLAFSMKPWAYTADRVDAFRQRADQAGVPTRVVNLRSWRSAEPAVADILASTDTPVGVFAFSDGLAVFIVRQCLRLGLAMPEQVAVLGVDNDTLTTRMMSPSISSIEIPWEKLGFDAAARLDRMIHHQPHDPRPTLIAPTGVVTRQTTDGLAIEDADVADAIRFIREHAGDPITIDHVLQHVPLSRRALEQRFKRALGRTLLDQITRVHIERAKQLLIETDYPIPEVARRSGYPDGAYFAVVFKKHTRQTPTAFRSGYRLG